MLLTKYASILAPGEGRKLFLLAFISFVVSHFQKRQLQRRWLQDNEKADEVKNHPFIPYLIENFLSFGIPLLARKFLIFDPERPTGTFLSAVVVQAFKVNTAIILQKLIADVFYRDVPYFSNTTKPSSDWKVIVQDYLQCNLPVDGIMAGLVVLLK